MRLLRATSLLAILALTAVACDDSGGAGTASRRTADLDDVVLISFDECDELLTHLREEGAERVGPWGLPGAGGPVSIMPVAEGGVAFDTAARGEAQAGAAASGVGGGETTPGFSGTNVQEEGVDEPDLVKTDGRRLVTVTGTTLHVVDVSGDAQRTGSVSLPDSGGHELLLHGDRALVLANGFHDGGGGGVPVPEPALRDGIGIAPGGDPRALLIEVDLGDPASPAVVSVLEVDGAYVSARLVDGTARVVLRSSPDLPFVHPTGDPGSEEVAETTNRTIVTESKVEDWLPSYRLRRGDETVSEGPLQRCSAVSRPSVFSGFGTLTVLTVPLDQPLEAGESTSVLAGGETVYASARGLYVATNRWPEDLPEPGPAGDMAVSPGGESTTTDIHAFDISGDGPATYLGSGSVAGQLLNQFSMSEHEGLLRVATTEGSPWGGRPEESESAVVVLEHQGDRLAEVGRVGGLGRTETIHAVRFIGDLGYVVTFRRTDPLYVVDLSDPTAPRVAGELKIPGYSAYLHPVGDGLLLGVGQDATEEGRTTGSQVSLFDVSDAANPRRLHQVDLGPGSSEVEWDHRAFLWWEPSSLAVLPIQRHEAFPMPVEGDVAVVEEPASDPSDDPAIGQSEPGASGSGSGGSSEPDGGMAPPSMPAEPPEPFLGAVGVSVHADSGVALVGEVTHQPHVEEPWQGQIRRSLVIGDRLFTISDHGVLVSTLADLADLRWVPLPA